MLGFGWMSFCPAAQLLNFLPFSLAGNDVSGGETDFGRNWWLLMLPLFRLSSYEPYEPLANRISFMLRFTGFVNMIRLIMPTNREKTWEHLWIFNYILHCPLNVTICNWIFLKCQSSTVANLAIISSWPILATGRKCSFERLPYLLLNYFLIWQELDLFSREVFPNWWRLRGSGSGNADSQWKSKSAKWRERRRQKSRNCKVSLIWELKN